MFTKNQNNGKSGRGLVLSLLASKSLTVFTLAVVLATGNGAKAHDHDHGQGGTCIEQHDMSVMFEPGVAAEEAEAIASLHESSVAFFVLTNRWTFTATDGVIAQGEAFTLTYSFVPDGTPINSSHAAAGTVSNLQATMNAGFPGGMAAFKAKVAEYFNEWGAYTNITYVEVADDGAGLPLAPGQLAGPGVVGRGDVRIAMHAIGAGPLAYNFFPQFGGDMVLDSLDMATFTNPANNFRSLRNVIMHEHAHGLGITHVIPQNGTKLMEPNLNTNFDGPQEDDIRAAQFAYGDFAEPNDSLQDAYFVGGPIGNPTTSGTQTFVVENVALEDANAVDFYAFTAFAGAPIALRVDPVGTSYEFGPQNGTPSVVDALAARNLGLRLWRRVSAQDNTYALLAQINFNAAGQSEYHPPITYTLAGLMVAEVYSTDGIDDVQRYTLTISNVAIEAPQLDPELLVANGLSLVNDGSTLLFGATEVGQTSSIALTVRNNGEGPLRFTGTPTVTVQGPGAGDYQVNLTPSEIAPNGTGVLGISFVPTQAGQRVAVISIPNNDPEQSDFSFIVSGTATAAAAPSMVVNVDGQTVLANDELDFGDIEVGETVSVALQIRNTGSAQLQVSSVQIQNADAADFSTNLLVASIAPGGSISSTLSVTPSAAGERVATLTIVNNGPVSPFVVDLFAIGLADEIVDCNGNGIDDAEDIANGTSEDCNGNGIPDECELDGDGDGVIDACDNCPLDFNPEQTDSNGNGIGDACDVIDNDDAGQDEDNADDDGGLVDDDVDGNDDDVVDDDDNNDNDDVDNDDELDADDDEIEDDNDVQDREENRENRGQVGGFCGAGTLGMIPAMMFGLCGMRSRRSNRNREDLSV